MNKATNKTARVMKISVTAVVLAILIFCLTSCGIQYGGSNTVYTKGELEQAVQKETDKDYDYICEYFDFWKLPKFNMTKIKTVEKKFNDESILTLPQTKIHAISAAEFFLENYYDSIDKSNVDEVTDALLYSYVYATGDIYAFYRTQAETEDFSTEMNGEFVGIGISVSRAPSGHLYVESVYPNSGAEKAGMLAGDVIVSVDGTELNVENQLEMLDAIKGEVGTNVSITVLRGDTRITLVAERALIKEKTVIYSLDKEGIGYIKITAFKANTFSQFREAIDYMESERAKGILFDVRGNPGGYLSAVIDILDYLIPHNNKIVSYREKHSAEKTFWSNSMRSLKMPCVVLCDGNTASAGELFTATIQDYSKNDILYSAIVGEATYGKGVMQSTFTLSDGACVTLTTAYYNPPSGVNYNKDGVHPDGVIPDIVITDDKSTDTDEQYDAAIEELVSLVQMYNGTIPKDKLLEYVNESTDNNLNYISQYLRKWKFPRFNTTKLDSLQTVYQDNVKADFDVLEAAKLLAITFIEGHYDSTRLSDYDKMTKSLINAWIISIDDEFSQYRTIDEHNDYVQENSGSFIGIGLTYASDEPHTITKVIPGGPADTAGIKVGDVLYSVNDVLFTDNADTIRDLIINTAKVEVKISVLREGYGQPLEFKVKRALIDEKSITYKVMDGNIGYVKISKFQNSTAKQFSAAISDLKTQGIKGFIFDLRDNTGGELTQTINTIEYLAKKGDPILYIDYFNDKYPDSVIYSQQSFSIDVPCVVICNKHTASAAELFTASVRDYAALGKIKATIVGDEHTFGKGVMQSTVKLYDGTSITYTVAYYNPPSGVNYDGIGIIPDIIVKNDNTVEGDEQLNEAINAINALFAN